MVIHKNTWYWGQTHTIVMFSGHAMVSVSVHNNIPGVATIHGISVTENHRRKGIGSVMLACAEDEAREMGATRIEICAENGSWVEDWYKRCGYKISGECEDWNGNVLVKDI